MEKFSHDSQLELKNSELLLAKGSTALPWVFLAIVWQGDIAPADESF
jgi:hypothetical protein